MKFPELQFWANGSGLTKAELARIQPGYPPAVEQAVKYAELILSVWIVAAVAFNSILFNTGRLIFAFRPRRTTMLAGVVFGTALVYLGLFMNSWQFFHTPRLYHELINARSAALFVGVTAIACGIIPMAVRRGKWRPTSDPSAPELATAGRTAQPSEHVKAVGRVGLSRSTEAAVSSDAIKQSGSVFFSRRRMTG